MNVVPHLREGLKTLLGVRLNGDVSERFCDLGLRPPVGARRRVRMNLFQDHGVLFIHVPKTAGMAVSQALYGLQVQHASIRYYQTVAPRLARAATSFAVVRDPIERFLSAYAYARAGGSTENRVSDPFRDTYQAFRDVDEALDHLEEAQWPYGVDHIFRPQAWYLTDRTGKLAVDHLVDLRGLDDALAWLAPWSGGLPTLNCSRAPKPFLSARQEWRIRYLYADDMDLMRRARADAERRSNQPIEPT
ncbi:MAG: hypothetical protein DI570_21455 [Phenylobacterium zucineum]|nr:MAG: hypothetical protein DI570_21455 [Phenylobacterium zucineum]